MEQSVNECVGGSKVGRVKVKVKMEVRRAEVGVWWKEQQSCSGAAPALGTGTVGGRRAKTKGAR